MTPEDANRTAGSELAEYRLRVAQLETIVCELILKNEQLRMSLRMTGLNIALPTFQHQLGQKS